METQAAVAEAAAEEAAAAVVAVVASEAMGGPEVPSLPLRNTGGRDTLPGPVAAQIQMHGLMLPYSNPNPSPNPSPSPNPNPNPNPNQARR